MLLWMFCIIQNILIKMSNTEICEKKCQALFRITYCKYNVYLWSIVKIPHGEGKGKQLLQY